MQKPVCTDCECECDALTKVNPIKYFFRFLLDLIMTITVLLAILGFTLAVLIR